MLCAAMLTVLLVAGLAGPTAYAQAGAFARMGFGARGIAMSNALAADASGHTSPYYNPALAPFTAGQHLEATTAFLSLDRELQFLQFATPLRPRAGVAAGLIHAGVSAIDGRDVSGYHTEDLSTDEFAFFLAFGTRIGSRLTAGLGLQLFRADYFEGLKAVNSLGLDLGLTVQVTSALRLGLVADDLLARYSWDTSSLFGDAGKTTSDTFPFRLRLGGAYTLLEGRALVTAEYESSLSQAEARTRTVRLIGDTPREVVESETFRLQDNRLRVGGEYRLVDAFGLRMGVDQIGAESIRPSAGFLLEQPVGGLVARASYAVRWEPYASSAMHFLTLRVFL